MIPDINLLPTRDTTEQKNRWILIIGAILWVLLLVLIIVQYILANNDLETMNSHLNRLELEKTMLEEQVHGLRSGQDTMSLQDAVTFVEDLTVPTSLLVEELLDLLPERSFLTNYSFSTDAISITAEFESLNHVAEYIANLESSRIFRDAKVDFISAENQEEESETTEEEILEFSLVPRYHVDFSIQVNMGRLAERGGEDE